VRVFVAGASGAIGRPLVPRLVAAGHEVTGMTRSERGARTISAAGAKAVLVDVFDAAALRDVVAEARPEVLVHQLTALPERFKPRKKDLYEATNRVRTEGTHNLLDAARASGTRRLVCQSIAFAYRPAAEPTVVDESAPLFSDAPVPFGEATRVVDEMERMVLGADALEALVLRYGWFYGPGTYFAPGGATASDVSRRRFPVVGQGGGLWSFVHVSDAADATVAAVEHGAPGVYNVVDDKPAAMRDWLPVYADALGAKPPRRVPVWMARLVAGAAVAGIATVLPGASNQKAKRGLGWQPAHPTWRTGFAESLRD
jgi:nucleoside-diphosphate-sugar epimerase